MEHNQSLVRYPLAAVVVIAAFWSASFVAGLVGWSFIPRGWHRVTDGLGLLAMSWAIATAGIAVARTVVGRSPLSWWLALGVLPPLYFGLVEGVGVL